MTVYQCSLCNIAHDTAVAPCPKVAVVMAPRPSCPMCAALQPATAATDVAYALAVGVVLGLNMSAAADRATCQTHMDQLHDVQRTNGIRLPVLR